MDKKILAISLIITMVICNSMTVWAADTWNGDTYIKGSGTDSSTTTNGTDSGTKTITGTFTKDSATTYEVNIIWGDLGYTYDGLISWNGSTYDGNDSKTNWSADMPLLSDIIDIQNLSDKKVKATFLLIENSDYISVDDNVRNLRHGSEFAL